MTQVDWDKELTGFELAVCENQASLFEECQLAYKCDAFDFVRKFMYGEVAAQMDNRVSSFHNTGTKQLGEYFLSIATVQPLSRKRSTEALYWLGYIYIAIGRG